MDPNLDPGDLSLQRSRGLEAPYRRRRRRCRHGPRRLYSVLAMESKDVLLIEESDLGRSGMSSAESFNSRSGIGCEVQKSAVSSINRNSNFPRLPLWSSASHWLLAFLGASSVLSSG